MTYPALYHFFISPWYFLFVVLWLGTIAGASIAYRRRTGRKGPVLAPESIRFEERHTSCRWATNVLVVVVTDEAVWTWVPFPFNLGFVPEVYDLEHQVPLESIQRIEVRRSLFRRTVRIHYTTASGRLRFLDLYLRDADGFVRAVENASPAIMLEV